MFKKSRSFLTKILVFALMLSLAVSLAKTGEIEAASKSVKVVYNVKQLKKAMKAKAASSIIFRTETVDEITIPYVKNAKNKELTVYAHEANITNKSRFKSIHVKDVNIFYENANKNVFYWDNTYHGDLVVMPGKTVKTYNQINYEYGLPRILIRKGAKISDYVFTAATGEKSKKDKKTGNINFVFQDEYLPEGNKTSIDFTLDKSGRITGMKEFNNILGSETSVTIKYDQNGNYTEYTSIYGETTTKELYKYDENDNLIEISSSANGDTPYVQRSIYDSDNNRIETHVVDTDGTTQYNYTFTYDKNKRIVSEYSDISGTRTDYTYDKEGRVLTSVSTDKDGNKTSDLTVEYDRNGQIKSVEYGNDSSMKGSDYLYDRYGQNIIQTFYGDDDVIFEASVISDDPDYVFEDGFVSPLISEIPYMDVKKYEKKGYTVVDTAKEFFEAIKPGAKIIMTQGYYTLSSEIDFILQTEGEKFFNNNKYVDIVEVFDGYEVVIHDVDGLLISGGSMYNYNTSIVTDPRYADVIRFSNCKNIVLNSLTVGHTESSECSGNVLAFDNTRNVKLYNMDLYGCGVVGIYGNNNSGNITVYNSKIHDCSYAPLSFDEISGNVKFVLCAFVNNLGGGYAFSSDKSFKLTFDRCVFGRGESNSWYFLDYATKKDCVFSEITQYPEYSD